MWISFVHSLHLFALPLNVILECIQEDKGIVMHLFVQRRWNAQWHSIAHPLNLLHEASPPPLGASHFNWVIVQLCLPGDGVSWGASHATDQLKSCCWRYECASTCKRPFGFHFERPMTDRQTVVHCTVAWWVAATWHLPWPRTELMNHARFPNGQRIKDAAPARIIVESAKNLQNSLM